MHDIASIENPVVVELSCVDKAFRQGDKRVPVLSCLDVLVPAGEILAVMGPSGGGKSTLLNLIAGLIRPDDGEVVVLGRNLGTMNDDDIALWRRRNLGFVFQAFHLVPHLTVGENVGLPLSLNGVDGAEQSERVRELLAAVGLPERAAAYPENLSGGEMQRVAIARAVSHRPALVLADEPTGNLDRETGQRVIQLLRWLVGEGGHTAVIVTHDVETVAICDRVLRLEDGRLRDTAP